MAKSRQRIIWLLEIFKEYSDSEHILTMKDIETKMKQLYNLSIDRRTVYDIIDDLIALGYDICRFSENKEGYYLRQRDFENSEVRIIKDAVYAFSYISDAQTQELISKLGTLQSIYKRNAKRYMKNEMKKKTDNKEVFWNIELLEDALFKKVKIKFDYFEYGLDKKLHKRREEKYIVNPYDMVCTNGQYYLNCRKDGAEKDALYRIDLIRNIELLEEEVDGKKELDLNKTTYAFAGEPERIKLRCKNSVIGGVIDRFGTDILIQADDDESFIVSFDAIPEGVKFWCLQYLSYVEVVEPLSLRKEIIKCLGNNMYVK